jgi:hypothetical protein
MLVIKEKICYILIKRLKALSVYKDIGFLKQEDLAMDEKRKFDRWSWQGKDKAVVCCDGSESQVNLLDVSTGGMKVCLSKSLGLGAAISGEFKILPQLGLFFVRGKVVREVKKGNIFETGIEFDKVSTVPLQD